MERSWIAENLGKWHARLPMCAGQLAKLRLASHARGKSRGRHQKSDTFFSKYDVPQQKNAGETPIDSTWSQEWSGQSNRTLFWVKPREPSKLARRLSLAQIWISKIFNIDRKLYFNSSLYSLWLTDTCRAPGFIIWSSIDWVWFFGPKTRTCAHVALARQPKFSQRSW